MFSFSGAASGARLADVRLEAPATVLTTSAVTSTSILERVMLIAGSAPSGNAMTLADGWLMRDSVVHTTASGGVAIRAFVGVERLLNVMAIATSATGVGVYADSTLGGICVPPYNVEVHATNVIARGGLYDLSVPNVCSGTQLLAVGHSNFRPAKVNEARPGSRIEDEGGNQDAEPLFAAPAAPDFHALAGSRTIDAPPTPARSAATPCASGGAWAAGGWGPAATA